MSEQDFQREVLRQLSVLGERTARIEAGQEERCKARGDMLDSLRDCHDDHEARLRSLEEHKALTKGQQAALTAVGTAVGAAAGALVPMLVKGGG